MAATSQPSSKASQISASPAGAARMTPPQPLLLLMGRSRVPMIPDRSALKQVWPGARRA